MEVCSYSLYFSCLNAPPQLLRVQVIPVAQEVKYAAAALPGVAVPAVAAQNARLIDFKRGTRIVAASMMPAERTASNSLVVEAHEAADEGQRIMLSIPRADTAL